MMIADLHQLHQFYTTSPVENRRTSIYEKLWKDKVAIEGEKRIP